MRPNRKSHLTDAALSRQVRWTAGLGAFFKNRRWRDGAKTEKGISMQTTVSRVLMTGNTAEPERVMLRKWAETAAENGGSFAIRQEWTESQWYTTYTINWPDGMEAPNA